MRLSFWQGTVGWLFYASDSATCAELTREIPTLPGEHFLEAGKGKRHGLSFPFLFPVSLTYFKVMGHHWRQAKPYPNENLPLFINLGQTQSHRQIRCICTTVTTTSKVLRPSWRIKGKAIQNPKWGRLNGKTPNFWSICSSHPWIISISSKSGLVFKKVRTNEKAHREMLSKTSGQQRNRGGKWEMCVSGNLGNTSILIIYFNRIIYSYVWF